MSFFLTTAIDYVNSRPHLGTAYEKITADVIARYKRLCGFRTHFLMGNDEHSQNVYRRALELGMDPLAYCDQMEREFRDVWGRLEISFDDFIRTSQPRHRSGVTLMLERIAAAGDLYEGWYEGPYCVSCEAFKPVKDLVDGLCPVHMTVPEFIREKNHFFRLSKYQRALVEHFDAHPEFLQPEIRRNEIVRLLESGLDDISVSRARLPALAHVYPILSCRVGMIEQRFALPHRSPYPLIVPCTWTAPQRTAASVFATARSPSLCV